MKCLYPKSIGTGGYRPCKKCMNCRITLQKVWAGRIMLEAHWYPRSSFITLTYDDAHVPMIDGVEVLHKPDLTTFIEKLRYRTKHIMPLRYFAVGEYGTTTWRPHYHLVVFGSGVEIEPVVNDAWKDHTGEQAGFTQVSELTYDRAMYIAHYTLKKMTKPDDALLKGRPPEFSRMSLKPGIGMPAIGWLADTLRAASRTTSSIDNSMKAHGDVFNHVRIYGRIFPLGQYMKRQLRSALGLSHDARERALQLGNYDTETGEIHGKEKEPETKTYSPSVDLIDVNTPWRQAYVARQELADLEKARRLAAKHERQGKLNLTTGDRI